MDTLPEAAVEPAEKALQHFQIWPRQPPPEIERINRENHERMLRSMRSGTTGSAGGGGSYSTGAEGHIQHGRHSFTHWEEKTAVVTTHHFHHGHEITITERLRMGDDGTTLIYANEVVGPKGKTHKQEITFDLN